jgi:hypothetical protein
MMMGDSIMVTTQNKITAKMPCNLIIPSFSFS